MTEDPERDVDEMQERVDRLQDEIEDVREDWERKKDDPGVPGAPEDKPDGGPRPETSYPAKGDEDV